MITLVANHFKYMYYHKMHEYLKWCRWQSKEEDPIIIESLSTSFEVFCDFKVKMDLDVWA